MIQCVIKFTFNTLKVNSWNHTVTKCTSRRLRTALPTITTNPNVSIATLGLHGLECRLIDERNKNSAKQTPSIMYLTTILKILCKDDVFFYPAF